MNISGTPLKKYYSFTVNGDKGGHVGVGDKLAVVIYSNYFDNKYIEETFSDNKKETAEEQAQRYVREHFDPNSEFFDDPNDALGISLL
jgi:hypothetical protein